jgi:Fe-S-cluster containining protein
LTNPHICSQCDSMNRSCCTLRVENNEGLPAPVSELEIKRILSVLEDNKREDFLDVQTNSSQFVNQMSLLFPNMPESIQKAFPLNENHFEIKTLEDSCFFKDDNGCLLPDEARPHFCRIYPFWFFGEEPLIFQDESCLALENCGTIGEVLLSLGTNSETLKQIHSLICEDWGLYRSIPQEKKKALL